jgi:ribonuclease E
MHEKDMRKNNLKNIILFKNAGIAIITENSKIEQVIIQEDNFQIGDIYAGNIKKILKNINAAFVEISTPGNHGFIQLENIEHNKLLQKIALTKIPINSSYLIVQITKEPSGNKGPSVSQNIELRGKYSSLFPIKNERTSTQKIKEEYDKQYLKIIKILINLENINIQIKEQSLKQNIGDIIKDLKHLREQWEDICIKLTKIKKPGLISNKIDFTYLVLRDFYDLNINKIIVESKKEALVTNNILMQWKNTKKSIGIEYYIKKKNLTKDYNLDNIFQKIIRAKIKLKSGASIVIEKTEALTVIDVNSGGFKNKIGIGKSTLWINCEAAMEISNQLILRNIGGVIVIDFIDMGSQKDQFYLLNYFNKFLNKDSNQPKIIQFSEIGLVELTRTRRKRNLYDILTIQCYKCANNGYILKNLDLNYKKKYNVLALETISIER